MARLEYFPESGWTVEEVGDPEIREILYGTFRIVYRHRERIVEIMTVHRGSRLFPEDLSGID